MSEQPIHSLPKGFRAAAARAGIKPSGGLDLAVFVADGPCSAAGTFTTNRICAAPVKWDRGLLPSETIRAVVVNSGNANAATGSRGEADAQRTATVAAEKIGCRPADVLVASTGVIGHQLPMDKLEAGLISVLETTSTDWASFDEVSRAIMTTDSRPKVVSRRETIGGEAVTLFGVAKGAAMIGPRMATMLGFLLTDASVAPGDLQAILSDAVEDSFNCISVEGHMSTNDTVLLLAGGNGPKLNGEGLDVFAGLVKDSCIRLARMIPDDGEGSTHLITIDVEGCRDREQARTLARAVADSALVKTAVHGADPNWGRIVSAAGYAGVEFEETELSLWVNGIALYIDGTPVPFDAQAASASIRSQREVNVRLVFRVGPASIRFWTCDLTAQYIHLNADYTT